MILAKKLVAEGTLTKTELVTLLEQYENEEVRDYLAKEALRIRKTIYGTDVYIRGLIEFTNVCKNDCYYCGIRKSNREVERYRLSKEEILSCCESGYQLGYRTFVLQGGEDGYFTDERITEIVKEIKEKYPDCAVTLSLGERSFESYRTLRQAGADRYLLRHEAASDQLYRKLHPENMHLSVRMQCLRDLKNLGYQVGAGFMVGAPYQSMNDLALDLKFLEELQPEMVGIGPFIPHHSTCFAMEPPGSVELTLFLLSVIRIMLPHVLLPATTALGTMDPVGREKGMLAGANVVMPNLSPENQRKNYELYDNKLCTGDEAAEALNQLKRRMESVGFCVVTARGDYKRNKSE